MQSCRFAYFNTHSLVDIVVAVLVLKGAGATATATATRTAKEHFSRASRFFVHSLLSFHDYSVNAFFTFCRGREHKLRQQLSFSFLEL